MKIKSYPQSTEHNATPEFIHLLANLSSCYPCVDRIQSRDFIQLCVQVLIGFEHGEAHVFPPGMIRKSHFTAPQAERLYTILWHLSTYALHLALANECAQYNIPQLPLPALAHPQQHQLFQHRLQSLQYYIMREMRRWQGMTELRAAEEARWRQTAQQLTEKYEELHQQLQAVQALPPLTATTPSLSNLTAKNNDAALLRPEAVANVNAITCIESHALRYMALLLM